MTQPTPQYLDRDAERQIVFPAGARAIIIDRYLTCDGNPTGSKCQREFHIQESASVEYYLIQDGSAATSERGEREGEAPAALPTGGGDASPHDAGHHLTLNVRQAAQSSFKAHVITFGGKHILNDVTLSLEDEGAECLMDGLYVSSGEQRIENNLRLDHRKPYGTSRLFFKGIVSGKSKAIFNGRVVVHEGAYKTDADQTNKNLILSDEAEADPKPELEIYNNDVKCSHGATVGQIDADQLYYLRSRGIGMAEARQMLTLAFANEIMEHMCVVSVRDYAKRQLIKRLVEETKSG